MKVYIKDNNIHFEEPAYRQRYNPYSKDYFGSYSTFTALIDRKENRMGWAYTIDMDYKGKMDQYSDIVIDWSEGEEEFININAKLKIPIFMLPKQY